MWGKHVLLISAEKWNHKVQSRPWNVHLPDQLSDLNKELFIILEFQHKFAKYLKERSRSRPCLTRKAICINGLSRTQVIKIGKPNL